MTALFFLFVVLASAPAADAGATSRLPSHIKAVSPELLLLWDSAGTVEAYSTATGALVQRLPFGREVVIEAAFDPRTSSFWGAGYDVAAETRFLWEWKPGAPAIRERPLEATEVWRVTGSRLLLYRNAADEGTIARVTRELTVDPLKTLPDDDAEPACTFSGADTPRSTSSPYWLDGTDAMRFCPAERCEERHWNEARLAQDAWLLCASDCLSCHERNGDAWIARSPLPRGEMDRLSALATDGRTVYALGVRDTARGEILRVHRSADRGRTWQAVELGCRLVPRVLGDVFFTNGSAWIPVESGLIELRTGQKPRTITLAR